MSAAWTFLRWGLPIWLSSKRPLLSRVAALCVGGGWVVFFFFVVMDAFYLRSDLLTDCRFLWSSLNNFRNSLWEFRAELQSQMSRKRVRPKISSRQEFQAWSSSFDDWWSFGALSTDARAVFRSHVESVQCILGVEMKHMMRTNGSCGSCSGVLMGV